MSRWTFLVRSPAKLLAACPLFFVFLVVSSGWAQSPAQTPASSPAPNSVEAMRRKVASIVIPSIDFRESTFEDAVEFVRQAAMSADPDTAAESRGVNIFVKPPSSTDDGSATATPGAGSVRITLNLRNVLLLDALRQLADSQGLEVTVERFAVCLEPRGSGGDAAPGQVKYADGETAGTTAAVMGKLTRIRILTLETHRATLTDVLAYLHGKSVQLDADEADAALRGVEILPPRTAAGSSETAAASKALKLTIRLRNVPLLFILRYVAVLADMDVEISPKAVTLVPHR